MKLISRLPFAATCGLVLTLCLSALAQATTLPVPSTLYPAIQAGVNAASNGDTVLVADGTYTGPGNRDIDFGGKNITVTSQHGAASTIIDCQGNHATNHQGFYLHSGETNVVINNLTVENGYEDTFGTGSGIDIRNVSAGKISVIGCSFRANFGNNSAGGSIFNDNQSSGTISVVGCMFNGNTAIYAGGGINNENNGSGTITVTNCTFVGNTASQGGGVENANNSNGTISLTNCIFTTNTARFGSGIDSTNLQSGKINITNCTLARNTASVQGGGIEYFEDSSAPITLANNILYGDTGGEVSTYVGVSPVLCTTSQVSVFVI